VNSEAARLLAALKASHAEAERFVRARGWRPYHETRKFDDWEETWGWVHGEPDKDGDFAEHLGVAREGSAP
jgi:hypothetical protein